MKSVLTVGLCRRDRNDLKEILAPLRWRIQTAAGYADACLHLQSGHFISVFCEPVLSDGDWKDILRHLRLSGAPPPLIVTSQLADVGLWAEVLNLGGFDVLLTPFERTHLLYVAGQAARHAAFQPKANAVCNLSSTLETVKVT